MYSRAIQKGSYSPPWSAATAVSDGPRGNCQNSLVIYNILFSSPETSKPCWQFQNENRQTALQMQTILETSLAPENRLKATTQKAKIHLPWTQNRSTQQPSGHLFTESLPQPPATSKASFLVILFPNFRISEFGELSQTPNSRGKLVFYTAA